MERLLRDGVPAEWQPTEQEIKYYGLTRFFTKEKMKTYLVKRHGSNAANQPMTQTVVLGTVEAENEKDAKGKAAELWDAYVNQHFEVKDFSLITKEEAEQLPYPE